MRSTRESDDTRPARYCPHCGQVTQHIQIPTKRSPWDKATLWGSRIAVWLAVAVFALLGIQIIVQLF